MAAPLVSVIIPVGPAHVQCAGSAVASALRSTVRDVEIIVVNDAPVGIVSTDLRVTVIDAPMRPGLRPAIARNAGLSVARGTFVLHLDADDYLLPDGLSALIRWHACGSRSYVYGCHYGARADGSPVTLGDGGPPVINTYGVPYDDWDYTRANLHAISALVPRALWDDVGGFDEHAPAWDDWTGFARLRRAGHCGELMPLPAFVYRIGLGQQHHQDNATGEAGMAATRARIVGEGWRPMGCGCGSGAQSARQVAQAAVAAGAAPDWGDGAMRVLEYVGPGKGTQTYRVNGRDYRAGNNASNRYLSTAHTLAEEDIPGLLALGVFREIPPPPTFAEAPPAEGITVTAHKASVIVGDPVPGDEDALETDEHGVARPTAARRRRARERGAA